VLHTLLSELRFRGGRASASLDQLSNINTTSDQNDETPRDIPRSTLRPPPPPPLPPTGHLDYLRNLIQSGSNRANPDDTNRALEALNRHIEEHHLDVPRVNHTNLAQVGAIAERQIQQLQTDIVATHSSIIDQLRNPNPRSSPSPLLNQEPFPPISRTLRRRSFRPDLRGISTLNETLPTPSLMPQPGHNGRDGRRQKRRKLETDDNREGVRGFNYGQYGQVVPGALKMEIASCDGGTYDPDGDSSFPENVLKNDQSVYCTKSDRCNLVLRHRGEAPFCLKKIVIKAPRTGFDSPIQEGMVFVSMTSDELLARTAQYQIQYSSARRRRRARRANLQPSQEYLHGFRSPLQSLERTVLMGPDSNAASERNENADRNANASQAEFRVTTEYDENSEDSVFIQHDDEDGPSIAELERIQEDDLICSDTDDSTSDDEDNDDTTMSTFNRRRLELQRRIGTMRRQYSDSSRRPQPPSLVDPLPSATSGPNGSNGAAAGGEVMEPHARFFIEREKSMVSIKFDPPPYVPLNPFAIAIRNGDTDSPGRAALSSSSCGVPVATVISIFRVSLPMDMRAQDTFPVAGSDERLFHNLYP